MSKPAWNVVDSSAWLAYFAGDDNAKHFAKPIEAVDRLLIPSIILTEIFKTVFRQRGEDMAITVVAHVQQGRVIPLDDRLAVDAALLGVEHKLPLADSIIYATARRHQAVIWTQDTDFQGLKDVMFYPRPG